MRLSQRQIQSAGGQIKSDGSISFPSISHLSAAMSMSYMGGLGGEGFFAPMEILIERGRQINKSGHTPDHDDKCDSGELAALACAYVFAAATYLKPTGRNLSDCHQAALKLVPSGFRFKPESQRKMLIMAGALILAEIERQDRRNLREDQDARKAA